MKEIISRRSFLSAAGVTVASVATATSADTIPAQPNDGAKAKKLGVRVNVATLTADSPALKSYAKAVDAMQRLKADDPRRWLFQANMHGAPRADGNNDAWRWCMHRNWWFLPWHRGYLLYFERIVRKLSEDDDFRLPYWAWEKPGQDVLPESFRAAMVNGKPNPLYDESRFDHVNAGRSVRPADMGGSFAADWDRARRAREFTTRIAGTSFGGLKVRRTQPPAKPVESPSFGVMEAQAHNLIHVGVAPRAGGNMADPATAARDPIFWLHHANVDRLWNRWLDLKGHYNPEDEDWGKQEFPFYDENGQKVSKSVDDILSLAAEEYRYDDDVVAAVQPPVVAKGKPVELVTSRVAAAAPMLALGSKTFSRPLTFEREAKPKLVGALAEPVASELPVLLEVENIQPPDKLDVAYEVFVVEKGGSAAPRYSLGPIAFFAHQGEHDHADGKGFNQSFDATRVLQTIRRENKGELPDLEVKIVPRSTNPKVTAEELAKKEINVPISNVTLKVIEEEKAK